MIVKSSLFVNFERLCVDFKSKFNLILAREREALERSFFAPNVLFDLYLQRVTLKNLKWNRHLKVLKLVTMCGCWSPNFDVGYIF